MTEPKTFLLSPAHCGGKRAATLFRPAADFELARRLRTDEGAALGEVFSYVSGLYFRGKLAYAERFGGDASGVPRPLVITSGRGLLPSSTMVTLAELDAFAQVPIDLADPRYREPLAADVKTLSATLPAEARVILLGSIATAKYVELLVTILGDRLCFPRPFLGVGDMARGAILLQAVRDGIELPYVSAVGAVRSLARRPSSAMKPR